MSVVSEAERLLGQDWRELNTKDGRVKLSYSGDLKGGTFYILRVVYGTPGHVSFEVARDHLPGKAKFVDAEKYGAYLYLTYHLGSM